MGFNDFRIGKMYLNYEYLLNDVKTVITPYKFKTGH
jgi:hypothetical protein